MTLRTSAGGNPYFSAAASASCCGAGEAGGAPARAGGLGARAAGAAGTYSSPSKPVTSAEFSSMDPAPVYSLTLAPSISWRSACKRLPLARTAYSPAKVRPADSNRGTRNRIQVISTIVTHMVAELCRLWCIFGYISPQVPEPRAASDRNCRFAILEVALRVCLFTFSRSGSFWSGPLFRPRCRG